MIAVAPYSQMDRRDLAELESFLRQNGTGITPYHNRGFEQVINRVFQYRNFSLVAFDEGRNIIGYLPQWQRGKFLESVPWRDRGGPVVSDHRALPMLVESTRAILREHTLKGVVWKDFQCDLMPQSTYFVLVEIDLKQWSEDTYWKSLSNKVRGKIRQAARLRVQFVEECNPRRQGLEDFYKAFVVNRRRLGVPAYPYTLFQALFEHFSSNHIKLFTARKDGEFLAGLILLLTESRAVDAFSASHESALRTKANDYLTYEVIRYCINSSLSTFDFGADSPLQESLIAYKTKWLGKTRLVSSSYLGKYKELDHNRPSYDLLKSVFRRMPMSVYPTVSRLVVR